MPGQMRSDPQASPADSVARLNHAIRHSPMRWMDNRAPALDNTFPVRKPSKWIPRGCPAPLNFDEPISRGGGVLQRRMLKIAAPVPNDDEEVDDA